MNAERILELAAFIQSEAHEWDMADAYGCFVGQFAAMTSGSGLMIEEALGISNDAATLLIMPPHYYSSKAKYSRKNAVAVLRKLAKTGKVVWPKAVTASVPS